MTNKQLENKISSAVSSMVPPNAFEEISEKIIPAHNDERTRIKMTTNQKSKILKFALPAVAACLVLIVGIFGFSYYGANIAVDSVIDIDVNPSIEISTNKKDKVIKVSAVNNDGVDILDGMNLEKTDLKVAVNAIIGSMVQKGYVVDENSGILVTVQNKDSKKAESLRNSVISDIDSSLSQYKVNAPVINQTLTDFDSAADFAKENGISYGKAVFVLNLSKKDASLNAVDLAKMSIRDIAALVAQKGINIKDIVDYDADDSIWENISDTIEDTNEDRYDDIDDRYDDDDKAPSGTATITASRAKEIALEHAGLSADKVAFSKAELDNDDGVLRYEIEFVSGNIEYEYEINAESGNIISSERDRDD